LTGAQEYFLPQGTLAMPLSYATDIKTSKNFLSLEWYFYPESPASSNSIEKRKTSAYLF